MVNHLSEAGEKVFVEKFNENCTCSKQMMRVLAERKMYRKQDHWRSHQIYFVSM